MSQGLQKDLREVFVSPKLAFLSDVLWEWIAIQERSARAGDAMWWYNERASVGGFAGAIWRSGGIVLEEFSTHKLARGKVMGVRNRAKTVVGRGDMDFLFGSKRYTLEAKHCWCRANFLRVPKALEKAKHDLKYSRAEGTKLAVVFAPLSLSKTSVDADIAAWTEKARQFKVCARAWVFPKGGHEFVVKSNQRCYPGVGIFIKSL